MQQSAICLHGCYCPCHKSGVRVSHLMACCEQCPVCKQNIAFGQLKEHRKVCHKKGSDLKVVPFFKR